MAFYVTQVSEAVDMIKDAAEKGYEVSANLMAVTTAKEQEIDQALEVLAETPASTLVVVDSYGAMYAEQVEILVKKYFSYGKATGKEVGIHAHNNQQLAFANTIEAIIHGANRMDASMGGLGRGAGNCPMELLVGFLRNPKFKMRPIYQCVQEQTLAAEPPPGMGPVGAVQHHRAAQRASPQRHRRPRRRPSATTTWASTTSWSTTRTCDVRTFHSADAGGGRGAAIRPAGSAAV